MRLMATPHRVWSLRFTDGRGPAHRVGEASCRSGYLPDSVRDRVALPLLRPRLHLQGFWRIQVCGSVHAAGLLPECPYPFLQPFMDPHSDRW